MNESLFIELVKSWFPTYAKEIEKKINDKKEEDKLFFEKMLSVEFSPNMRWDSMSTNESVVAADLVSLDSELPLKSRGSLSRASGDIPKLGLKMQKDEKLVEDIELMRARGAKETEIVNRIFEDLPKVVAGIRMKLEIMFLQAISTGCTSIDSETNTGIAVRVKFNIPDKNKYGVAKKWGNPDSKPLTDIERIISAAAEDPENKVVFTTIMLSQKRYNQLRKSDEVKDLYARHIGFMGENKVSPTPSKFNEAFYDEYKIKFIVVDSAITIEKNGKKTAIRPFDENAVVFLTTEQVGRLFYGKLVEESNPVRNVEYQKIGAYTLVSKWSVNDPYREFTGAQSKSLPVLDNTDSIYLMDTTKTVKPAADEVEGDDDITVFGETVLKADVVAALKAMGVSVPGNPNKITDAKLLEKIGGLSDAQKEELKTKLGIA